MNVVNCIMVYHRDKKQLLFCKRTKEPYLGKYNLVGGKKEEGETGFQAAYRELQEETGITSQDIELTHMMDYTYFNQKLRMEIYVGFLEKDVYLKEEAHPLFWMKLNHENFFDLDKFAGEGNIGHMIEQVREYGVGEK